MLPISSPCRAERDNQRIVQPQALHDLKISGTNIPYLIIDTKTMGLRMDDIHTPTISSGPTSRNAIANDMNKETLPLMDLIAEKDRVESDLSALSGVLDSVC